MARTLVNSVIIKPATTAQVGDVVQSTLTEAQFQAQRDSTWVLMDGRDVTGSDYDTIVFGGIGGNIPDARGQFLRGKNNTRSDGNEDPDGERDLGNFQADEFKSHQHNTYWGGIGGGTLYPEDPYISNQLAGTAHAVSPSGGAETRPKNIAINIFIKINE